MLLQGIVVKRACETKEQRKNDENLKDLHHSKLITCMQYNKYFIATSHFYFKIKLYSNYYHALKNQFFPKGMIRSGKS